MDENRFTPRRVVSSRRGRRRSRLLWISWSRFRVWPGLRVWTNLCRAFNLRVAGSTWRCL